MMKLKDLITMYDEIKKKEGDNAYKLITKIFKDAKKRHKKDFLNGKTAQNAKKQGRTPDHEQSWKAFKGKNLEGLILHILEDQIKSIGLKIIKGSYFENNKSLDKELSQVRRNVLVDFGEFGYHLPDVDLIIYNPSDCRVLAVISLKVSLRERATQTGYWKMKLSADKLTNKIKVYFFTLDEDGSLTIKKPAKKARAIVETDTDGCYVLSKTNIENSAKVKTFDKFIGDISKLKKS